MGSVPSFVTETMRPLEFAQCCKTANESALEWVPWNVPPEKLGDRLRGASPKDIDSFVAAFTTAIRREPSAGKTVLKFTNAVLSVIDASAIGELKRLTESQKAIILKLCDAVNERPLPGMLWADFVQARLEEPAIVAWLLAICERNQHVLEERIREVMRQKWRHLFASAIGPIVVIGYSATLVAAARGLPKEELAGLKIVSPEQGLPDRDKSDGERLKGTLHDAVPWLEVEVLPNDKVVKEIVAGKVTLTLMGCRVIGLRKTGVLEVVNSKNSSLFVEAASRASIPVVVIAGAYKLWPMRTYEKYRPTIVLDERNDVMPQQHVSQVMTEHDVMPIGGLSKQYHSLFTVDGIPVATLQTCLREEGEKVTNIETYIDSVVQQLLVGANVEMSGKKRQLDSHNIQQRLPRHWIEAERYYQEELQKDEDWLKSNLGKYVAIIGRQIVDSDLDFHALSDRVREKYGYGPIFMPKVTRGPRIEYLGFPRARGR